MASWMVHLRVADILLDRFYHLYSEEFFMGNVAPDSGVPSADWRSFDPPNRISHFVDDGEDFATGVNPENFARKYLVGKSHTRQRLSFFIGYYVHLVTDSFWKAEISLVARERYQKELEQNPDFIWEIKRDWYDLDHLFLRDHPGFRGYRIYQGAKDFPNTYMEEFTLDAFMNRHEYITGFYDKQAEHLDREYPYLSKEAMDAFVIRTAERIEQEIYAGRFAVSKSFMEQLPEEIKAFIEGISFYEEDIGCSGAKLLMFENQMVLKVSTISPENDNECHMMAWLAKQKFVPVPEVFAHIQRVDEGKNYLLMSRVPGKMACEEAFMRQPHQTIALLAKSLQMLWSIDISDCPADQRIAKKLLVAAEAIENDEVDLYNMEPETFGSDGFQSLDEIMDYLRVHAPSEQGELVLSHGDFCLPNIFFSETGDVVTGFIDLGRMGVADRYQDIALCLRSFKYNLSCFGQEDEYESCKHELFELLGLTPNEEKIYYYRLLDELF